MQWVSLRVRYADLMLLSTPESRHWLIGKVGCEGKIDLACECGCKVRIDLMRRVPWIVDGSKVDDIVGRKKYEGHIGVISKQSIDGSEIDGDRAVERESLC